MRLRTALPFVAAASLAPLSAQTSPEAALASWLTLDVVTGYELRVTPTMAESMPGWAADAWGNLVVRVGTGSPRRVLACGLDRPAYAASQITDDGYLRVHRIGGGSGHPLWDQAFEAQQVRVLTKSGPVAGVVARTNGHFSTQHRGETAVSTADDLWVDVGATSAADVAALGIGLLDPIIRHLPAWPMTGEVAGPSAGARVGCAAVASLAESARNGTAPEGETHFVLSAQDGFNLVGLSSHVARSGRFDGVTILGPGAAGRVVSRRVTRGAGRIGTVIDAAGVDSITWIQPATRSPGSHMEGITVAEARGVLRAAAATIGVTPGPELRWVEAPSPRPLRTDHMDASVAPVAELLTALVERHGVPDHEWSVRRLVLESMPEWARARARVDDMGNIMVEMGPDADTTVFMAHLDEVGYLVESITEDGVVSLTRTGGALDSAWEGQTALLHFSPKDAPSPRTGDGSTVSPAFKRASLAADAPEPLRGVFLSRDRADQRNPSGGLKAWFGMDRSQLEARGVVLSSMVTSHKEGLRMGRHRFVARALDDRAGTTALLLALRSIDPDNLPAKVVFTWSVHEEGGLVGAEALAKRYARTTHRIYSIDTFVSSDTPLESPHFAYAPLGAGPVLRAIENSGASPDAQRTRVFAAAERAGIPLQMGLTQGGTDGTTFTFRGAPNQGLSWPGRYSHSPGEVLDLRDLQHLSRLIVELTATR